MTPADAPAPALAEALAREIAHVLLEGGGLYPHALAQRLVDGPLAAQAAEIAVLKAERDEARDAIALCNNSFGSYSYHLNPHPAEQIEKIKEQARSEWRRAETAEARAATAEARCERLLIAFHDAIRRPLGVTPDSGAEFFTYRMSDEAEERRPRHGSEAEIAERPETRLRAALAAETEARRGAERERDEARKALPDSLQDGDLVDGVRNLAMGYRATKEGFHRYGRALSVAIAFLDYAADEGLSFEPADGEDASPMDAADACTDMADDIRADLNGPIWQALREAGHARFAARAALSDKGGAGQ